MLKEIVFNIHAPMISGQSEAQSKVFRKVHGKTYTWYVSVQENAADNIYVVTHNKEGMGGAKLKFTMEDGSVEEVHAPWHSNADSLFDDTGEDVRQQSHLTYVISLERSYGKNMSHIHTDLLDYCLEPIITSWGAIQDRAKKYAHDCQRNVFVSIKGVGGGRASFEEYKGT